VKVANTNHESRGRDVCNKGRDKSATNPFVSL